MGAHKVRTEYWPLILRIIWLSWIHSNIVSMPLHQAARLSFDVWRVNRLPRPLVLSKGLVVSIDSRVCLLTDRQYSIAFKEKGGRDPWSNGHLALSLRGKVGWMNVDECTRLLCYWRPFYRGLLSCPLACFDRFQGGCLLTNRTASNCVQRQGGRGWRIWVHPISLLPITLMQ